jgi:hypothetical protein
LFEAAALGERLVLGDAHHDKGVIFVKGCGKWGLPVAHVSSTYITPREEIARFWPAPTRLAYWGNTRRMPQCDGSTPHGDGYVLEEPASVPPSAPAAQAAARTLETSLKATEAALLPPPALCAHESPTASLRRAECDLDATLTTLHEGAQNENQAVVCQLMIPAAVAETPRQPEHALKQYAASCEGRLYAPQLQHIAAGTAGLRAQDVLTAGHLARATLSGPRASQHTSATFAYLGQRWRLLMRSD